MYRVNRYAFTAADAFYERALPFWMQNEAANCLSIGITWVIVNHPERFAEAEAEPYLAMVEDERGEVVMTALRTPPRDVILSLCDHPIAIEKLVADLHTIYDTLSGINAEIEVGRSFAEQWGELSDVGYRLNMPERIFQIERVQMPSGIPGVLRRAAPDDKSLVVGWMVDFEIEAFNGVHAPPEQHAKWFDYAIVDPNRGIYLWEDGGVMSLVCHGGITPNGMRIGPVYTPPDKRGRGYASVATAGVSQMLLDSGRKFCFLYTDLRNPTSNKIYQQIGYKPVIDCGVYGFVERS